MCLAILLVPPLLVRSPLTPALILPRLEQALNVRLWAGAVHVNWRGEITLSRVVCTLPDMPGNAGRFFRAATISAGVSWSALWEAVRGRGVRPSWIRMTSPVLTVSQSLDDGTFNLSRLTLPAPLRDQPMPTLTIEGAAIELGEHSSDRFRPLRRMMLQGRLAPVDHGYEFAFQENASRVRQGRVQPPCTIRGRSVGRHIEGVIEHVALADWPAESLPAPLRATLARLELTGDAPRAWFRYAPERGLEATLDLHSVGMNLPVPQRARADAPTPREEPGDVPTAPRNLRMHGVSGTIELTAGNVRIRARGLIEEMPYEVDVVWGGTDIDAPFTCEFRSENFRVEGHATLLPYVPPTIGEYVRLFSSPRAVVDARVTVQRQSRAAPIVFAGEATVRDGEASLASIPYRFRDLTAHVQFNNERIEIVQVRGRADSGATLEGRGLIAPLHDEAEASLHVQVRNVPWDDQLRAALGTSLSEIVDTLCSQEEYRRLVAEGWLTSPLANPLPENVSDSAGHGPRPGSEVFVPGGTADVDVLLRAPRGLAGEWDMTVDVHLARVGLVPAMFPYPLIGRNVHVRITDHGGELISGHFSGLHGGEADISAQWEMPTPDRSAARLQPRARVAARDIPLDPLLYRALPAELAPWLGETLQRLALDGSLRAEIVVGPRHAEADAPLGFDATVEVAGARARCGHTGTTLADISGRVSVSEQALRVDVSGTAWRDRAGNGPGVHAEPWTGTLTLHADARFDTDPPAVEATLTAADVDLSGPVETLVATASPGSAETLAELRATFRPAGRADFVLRIERTEDRRQARLEVTSGRNVGVDACGGRIEVPELTGRIEGDLLRGTVRLEHVGGHVLFNGVSAGDVEADGVWHVPHPDSDAEPGVRVAVRGARLESPLMAALIEALGGTAGAAAWRARNPHGVCDADAHVRQRADGSVAVSGRVRPVSLTLVPVGTGPVPFAHVDGVIEFDPQGGRVRGLRAGTDQWTASFDGAWHTRADGTWEVRGHGSLRARSLTEDLRALLPAQIATPMHDVGLSISGPLTIPEIEFVLSSGPAQARPQWHLEAWGNLHVEGLTLDVGVPVRDVSGQATATVRADPADGMQVSLKAWAAAARVANIPMHDVVASLAADSRSRSLTIEGHGTTAFGGRGAARATIVLEAPPPADAAGTTDPARPPAVQQVQIDARLADVRFAPLLEALAGRAGVADDDTSRGLLSAQMTLVDIPGRTDLRRGRAWVRVAGGRVMNLPLAMRLVEVSNLQLPVNARLDYAQAVCFIQGPTIHVEEALLISRAVVIAGEGTVHWPDLALDMRFTSRAARRIPLLSFIFERVRDELVATSVRGRLWEPDVALERFPGPRRIVAAVTGQTPSNAADRWFRPGGWPAGTRLRDRPFRRGFAPVLARTDDGMPTGVRRPATYAHPHDEPHDESSP